MFEALRRSPRIIMDYPVELARYDRQMRFAQLVLFLHGKNQFERFIKVARRGHFLNDLAGN